MQLIVGNTCASMLRATGAGRAQMCGEAIRLKSIHEVASLRMYRLSLGDDAIAAMADEACVLCSKVRRHWPGGPEMSYQCPACLLHVHDSCAEEALACLARQCVSPFSFLSGLVLASSSETTHQQATPERISNVFQGGSCPFSDTCVCVWCKHFCVAEEGRE